MYQSDLDKAVELQNAGKLTDALEYYKEILATDPYNIRALHNSAYIKDDLGDIEGAFEDYFKAVKIDPNFSVAYYNIGCLYYYKKIMYDKALPFFTKAIVLGVSNIADAFHNRGLCYEKLGLLDKAVEDLSKSINLDPKNSNSIYNRARVYIKREAHELAYNDFINAIKMRFPEYGPEELVTLVCRSRFEDGLNAARRLINAGFYVSFYGDIKKKVVVIPRVGDRIVLALHELHIGKTIKRHLIKMKNRYELCFNYDFSAIMDGIKKCHQVENDIFLPPLCHFSTAMNQSTDLPKAIGFGLLKDGKFVAGEFGFVLGKGKFYSSYSGFHDEDNAGTVQIILLAQFLKERGFMYFDFGPTTNRDSYKIRLGATKMSTDAYLSLFASINPESAEIFKKNVKPEISLNGGIHGSIHQAKTGY